MDKFLETQNLPRLNNKEIEHLNRSISSKEFESVMKNIPTKKSPGPDGFTGKFHQTFKEGLIQIPLKFYKTLKRREHFKPHSMRPVVP